MNTPPSPQLSAVAQTLRFTRDPFAFLAETRAECGDIFSLRLLGMGNWVFLCAAEHLQELYKKSEDQVVAGEIRKELAGYLFGPRGSVSLDGDEYAQRRKVTMPFFAGRQVIEHTGLIQRLAKEKMSHWRPGDTVKLQPFFNRIALEVTSRILFGPLDQQPAKRLVPLAERYLETMQHPAVQVRPLQWDLGRWTPWGRFMAARRKLGEALEAEVRTRQNGADSPDKPTMVLEALAAANFYEDEDENRQAAVDELVSFIVGGSETTSRILSWTVLGLLKNPDVLGRLLTEIDTVLDGGPIETRDLRKLPYLHAVTQEGLRFQTSGPIVAPRLAKKDIELGGYSIPAGTRLAQCFPQTGRGQNFPKPEEFDPETNFMGRDVKMAEWVPFGGGTRMCAGMGLAQLELTVVTGTLMQNLDLELGSGSITPVRSGIAFQPANELEVRIRKQRLSA